MFISWEVTLNKVKAILSTLLPMMAFAAMLLEQRDSDTTGADDKIAGIIKTAVTAIQAVLLSDVAATPAKVGGK